MGYQNVGIMRTSGEARSASLKHAAEMLAGDPASALRIAETLRREVPSDPRALLILGSARRRLGDLVGAREVLEPLATTFPEAANTQYELGLTLVSLGELTLGREALLRATALNRDHGDAWGVLGDMAFRAGDTPAADRAYAEQLRSESAGGPLAGAADAFCAGRPSEAETLLRRHLLQNLEDAAATRMLGEVYLRQERHDHAETLLSRAVELDPDHDGARFSYAEVLFRQQRAADAISALGPLLARRPDDPAYLNLLAGCLALTGSDEQVLSIYEQLLAEYPSQQRLWLNYGHALRAIGRRQHAVAAYRHALEGSSGLGDAYWSLANLKSAEITRADEARMQSALSSPNATADDRLHLHYALGKALEDRRDFALSFKHYAWGATLRRRQAPYSADDNTRLTSRMKAAFTAEFFSARGSDGCDADDAIFIVGLPRSGSTLVEQILASHTEVEGTMELPDVGVLVRGLGPDYPECLRTMGSRDLRQLGESYLERTRVHRRSGKRRFIDKMPNNFQHVGLIRAILPRATIIDVRRHPMAACFSAFKQHFAQGQAFSYDLIDLGRFYQDYTDLMAHFDAVMPGQIIPMIYEDLVDDTSAQVERLLARCGLPFQPACLSFWETRRAVRTVSSEQVRQPIFRTGIDQWRNYQQWLTPLKSALGSAMEHWRSSAGEQTPAQERSA